MKGGPSLLNDGPAMVVQGPEMTKTAQHSGQRGKALPANRTAACSDGHPVQPSMSRPNCGWSTTRRALRAGVAPTTPR